MKADGAESGTWSIDAQGNWAWRPVAMEISNAWAVVQARNLDDLFSRIRWAHDHGRRWEAKTVTLGWEIHIEMDDGETYSQDTREIARR